MLPWTDEQRQAFLFMQFQSQTSSYQMQFPYLERNIILDNGIPAGRLLVERRADEIRMVDLSLLPPYRGHGIGTTLIDQLKAEAYRANAPLRLHVETFNPARRLYDRLGFQPITDRNVYIEMEWRPSSQEESTKLDGRAKGQPT